MMTLRVAAEGDLSALTALEARIFSDPWSENSLRAHLGAAHGLSLVAEEGGEVLGYLLLSVLPPEGEIYRLAVHPDARRRGIGEALLTHAAALLAAKGVSLLFLDVRAGNTAAMALYKKFGFYETGRRKDYYRAPREDAILMEKRL